MKTVTIRGIDFTCPEELQDYLASELSFPEYYGRNLDALYDVLTDIDEETTIEFDLEDMDDSDFAEYLSRVIRVVRDAAEANHSICVVFSEE